MRKFIRVLSAIAFLAVIIFYNNAIGLDRPTIPYPLMARDTFFMYKNGPSAEQNFQAQDTILPEAGLTFGSKAVNISYDTSILWTVMRDVVIRDGYAFCAMAHGLVILDMSNPASPTLVSQLYIQSWNSFGITKEGDYVYIAAQSDGLKIINISDITHPYLAGTFSTSGIALDVAISGNLAYIAVYDKGLQIVDVSLPSNPILVGNSDTPGYSYGVVVSGIYAYIADWTSGLQIIDVSDPANPSIVANCDTPSYARRLTLRDNYAYIADLGDFAIVNISDPLSPYLQGNFIFSQGDIMDVTVEGNFAFAASKSGLRVLDISDPSLPEWIGGTAAPYAYMGIGLLGPFAYLAKPSGGLWVVNIADPYNPLGMQQLFGVGVGAFNISKNHAYLLSTGDSLKVINIAGGLNTIVSTIRLSNGGDPYKVAIKNNYAYIPGDSLFIVEISNPALPIRMGAFRQAGDYYYNAIAFSGNYAFLANWDATWSYEAIRILDINNPGNPILVGSIDALENINDLIVRNNLLIASYETYHFVEPCGIKIFDITNPINPVTIANITGFPWVESPYGLAVYGDYLYVMSGGRMLVYDISIPSSPTLQFTSANDYPSDYLFPMNVGKYLFISGYEYNGFMMVDIHTPTIPTIVTDYALPGVPNLAIYNDNIYLTSCGFMTLNVSGIDFICGDANDDGVVNILDVTFIINYIYKNGRQPFPAAACDVNSSGSINILDITYLISYLHKHGPAPYCP